MEVHKVLHLPRHLHMEVHKVLHLPRNLHMCEIASLDGWAWIALLEQWEEPETGKVLNCVLKSGLRHDNWIIWNAVGQRRRDLDAGVTLLGLLGWWELTVVSLESAKNGAADVERASLVTVGASDNAGCLVECLFW